MKRRYVDTRHGQLHVTDSGDAAGATGETVLLMHWVPLSGRMYEYELPVFAAAGVRALAVDLMGFGRSDPRKGPVWSVPQHADVLEDLLRELGARSITVMGGHYSTPVAVELAQRERIAGSDVRRLVIDGGPMLPPEAFQALLQRARLGSGPGLKEDGSHRTWLWDQAVHTFGMFAPQDFRLDDVHLPQIYGFVADFIAAGLRQDMSVLQPYDFAAKLAAVTLPTLVLTAETEPLRASFEPLCATRGECKTHIFPADHPINVPTRRGEFARAILEFIGCSDR
ncbi:MAG: alpha/beta fold hydrolase [Gammaproteobacteria bacterium]|nr:alpha/beta fold hydrolase [Gammaproteobacteria bacterium]